jgi:hypothetical protein
LGDIPGRPMSGVLPIASRTSSNRIGRLSQRGGPGQPPATAGSNDTLSPAATGVSSDPR